MSGISIGSQLCLTNSARAVESARARSNVPALTGRGTEAVKRDEMGALGQGFSASPGADDVMSGAAQERGGNPRLETAGPSVRAASSDRCF